MIERIGLAYFLQTAHLIWPGRGMKNGIGAIGVAIVMAVRIILITGILLRKRLNTSNREQGQKKSFFQHNFSFIMILQQM